MRLILPLIFIINLSLFGQQFFANHPELDWKVIETENFLIHYTEESAWTAAMASKVAEEVIGSIEKAYDYKPDKKYALILKDVDDYSNGAAYFFNDKVEIWAQNLDYPMRGTRHWLYDVLTHELTHMINIQASIKTSKTVPFGFIQVLTYESERRADVIRGFPNGIVSYPLPSINIPVWFAEGSAQYQNKESRYDYWDSHRDMVLRDRFEYDQVLSYSGMGVFGKNSHGNESAYNQGFDFVGYLADTYGDSVLMNVVKNNAKFSNWTFEGALFDATGAEAEEIYAKWYDDRKSKYGKRLEKISKGTVIGRPIERGGFANYFPRFSPDGKNIAYVTNKENDYWSQNKLIFKNILDGEEQVIDAYIASGPAFSPDGRFIAYTKSDDPDENDSHYQDIYIYDTENDEEYQITENLRSRHLDWSVNNEIAFVISQDGTGYLYKAKIDVYNLDRDYTEKYIMIQGGDIKNEISESENSAWRNVRFKFETTPEKLSRHESGRQIYHPRWSSDGSMIVYAESNGYGRSITLFSLIDKSEKRLLHRICDDRDPVFSDDDQRIYFSSDSTGIFNIYSSRLDGSDIKRHTNTVGGAFMPHVTANKMTYALYDSLGYNIHYFPDIAELQESNEEYYPDYSGYIPEKSFENVDSILTAGKPYRANFSNFQILPRIFFDYGTFKPGIFIMNSDPLDKWMFFGGVAVNFDLERDIYLYTAYNGFKPTLFLEFFNVTQNLSDTASIKLSDIPGPNQYLDIPQDLFFNLFRISVGTEYTIGPMNLKAQLIYNRYDATVTNDEIRDPVRDLQIDDIPLSYTYLKGPQIALSGSWDSRKRDRLPILPRVGEGMCFFAIHMSGTSF